MKKHLLKLLLLCCIGILALSLFACVPSTGEYKLEFIVDGEVYYSRTTNGYSRIDPPEDPKQLGFSFAGWYFDEDFTEEYHSYSLELNPIKEDTKVYAKWVDAPHTCEAGEWIVQTPATCKDTGVKYKKCIAKNCSKVLENEIIPISEDHAKPYTVETITKAPTCKEEGEKKVATYCSLCNRRLSEKDGIKIEIDINAHNYINGSLTRVNGGFDFRSECSICNKVISLSDVDVVEEVTTEATCTSGGFVRYTYTSFGGAVSAEEPIPALKHCVAGVAIEDTKTYSEFTHKEILEKVDLYENTADCGDVVLGQFLCETCNTYCDINVNKPHSGEWSLETEPTCHSAGKETLDECTVCSERNLKRNVAPTGEHIKGDLALNMVDIAGGKYRFDLVKPCVNRADGCDDFELILEDVPVTSEERIGETCDVPDVVRYIFNDGATSAIYDHVIRSGHFLDGVRASTIADYSDLVGEYFDYSLITSPDSNIGIKLFADRVLSCNEFMTGYYICTCCDKLVDVKIYRPHVGNWVTTVASSCTAYGTQRFDCDFCDYHEEKSLPLADHEYAWQLIIDRQPGQVIAPFAMVADCSACHGASKKIENVLVTTNISKQPTCYADGEIIYTHIFEGKEYHTTEKIDKISHSIDGVIVNESGRFDYAEYVETGKVVLKSSEPLICDSGVGVNGYFTCSECGENVDVKVYRTHKGEIVETLYSGSTECVKIGERYLDCVYDGCEGTTPAAFREENHKYTVKVTANANTNTVEVGCSVQSCGYYAKYENLATVNVKVIVLATCKNSGVTEYTFTHGGVAHKYVVNIDKGNHTFCGVDYTTLLDENGKMPSNIEGIRVNEDGNASFKCEVCGQLVQVETVVVANSDEE